MVPKMKMSWRLGSWMLATTMLAGCGGGSNSAPPKERAGEAPTESRLLTLDESDGDPQSENRVVPASGTRQPTKKTANVEDEGELEIAATKKDSPEWFILQLTRLKLRPLGDDVDAFAKNPERQAELRREGTRGPCSKERRLHPREPPSHAARSGMRGAQPSADDRGARAAPEAHHRDEGADADRAARRARDVDDHAIGRDQVTGQVGDLRRHRLEAAGLRQLAHQIEEAADVLAVDDDQIGRAHV